MGTFFDKGKQRVLKSTILSCLQVFFFSGNFVVAAMLWKNIHNLTTIPSFINKKGKEGKKKE